MNEAENQGVEQAVATRVQGWCRGGAERLLQAALLVLGGPLVGVFGVLLVVGLATGMMLGGLFMAAAVVVLGPVVVVLGRVQKKGGRDGGVA